MKILLTGANGYIGKRLLPVLIENGHEVYCAVRNKQRFDTSSFPQSKVKIIEVDFLNSPDPTLFPDDLEAAYYLIHSLSSSTSDFTSAEEKTASNFISSIDKTNIRQVIYLGGIANDENLSKHLSSRKKVGDILEQGNFKLTILRAGIIVGSGSASFEIIRDLVEKLPVMIAPKWLQTRSQPIAISDVIRYLTGVLNNTTSLGKTYDIGGPEVLTYKEMLMQYAEVRKLRRWIISVPVLTPRLSSYWLYFVTSTTFTLAMNLVDSMKNEVVCNNSDILDLVPGKPLTYNEAVEKAFQRIEENMVYSSCKDSFVSVHTDEHVVDYIKVPSFGCFKDRRAVAINQDPDIVLENVWSIGGQRGWYFGNFLWRIRGFIDKIVGGVGLRRGRTNVSKINVGDALDFWRVIAADRQRKQLLLYAEMKLPGEAWLEFRIHNENDQDVLVQEATFRPRGIAGRLYWYGLLPIHNIMFEGMARNVAKYKPEPKLSFGT
jgi:uncharacterized protein YbjT (DUF2867 family)